MTIKKLVVTSVSVLTCVVGLSGQSQRTAGSKLQIESLMTAAEFKSCGLNKLSSDELSHLNDWLETFAGKVKVAVNQTRVNGTPDVIESEIAGDFNGWDGETIFKLDNGQIWQQSEYDYEYEYAYRPKITIYKTGGGYKMKVEGMEDTIYVRRLK